METNEEFERCYKLFGKFIKRRGLKAAVKASLATILPRRLFSKVSFQISDDLKSRTNGKDIWVSLIKGAVSGEYKPYWPLLIKTSTAHEASHILHSDFNDLKEIREFWKKLLTDAGVATPNLGFASELINIIEDGRIERIITNDFPGLVNGFLLQNKIIRETNEIYDSEKTAEEEWKDFMKFILSYAKTGAFPIGWDIYKGSLLYKTFILIADIIDEGVNAASSDECRKCCEGILEDVLPYYLSLMSESEDFKELAENGGSGEDVESNGCSAEGNENSKGGSSALRSPRKAQQSPKESSPADAKESCEGSANSGDASSSVKEKIISENAIEPSDDSLKEAAAAAVNEITNAEKIEAAKEKNSKAQLKITYGNIACGFLVENMRDKLTSRPLPKHIASDAASLKNELQKIITAKKQDQRFKKSGTLDLKRLHYYPLGREDLFKKPGEKSAGNCVFYLLIDNSGSMSGEKHRKSCESSAVIEEALSALRIPFKVAMFSDYTSNNHLVLKDFDEKPGFNVSYSASVDTCASGGNTDAVHISYAAYELMKRNETKKFLIIISDGTPSNYLSKNDALTEVRSAVDSARKSGIIIAPIMFGNEQFFKACKDDYFMMYGRHVIACQPENINKSLALLLRNLVK